MPFSRELEIRVQTEGVNTATSRLDNLAAQLGTLKGKAGLAGAALTALSAGGLLKATAATSSFNDAVIELEKVAGEDVAGELRGEILSMANEIPLTQEKLAGLTADAARFGIRGKEALRSFAEQAAKMSVATNLSASRAGESLAKLAELTGTPVDEMNNLSSAINSLSNTAATSSSEIVQNSLRSASSLRNLGLSQQEILGLAASLNEVSESSERAGTRLRRVGQVLLDPKKAEDIAGALGMTASEFKRMRDQSPVETIQLLAESLNSGGDEAEALRRELEANTQKALSALGQNLEGVNSNLRTSRTEYEKGTSSAEEFATATDTLSSKLQITRNRLRNIAITTGSNTVPAATRLTEKVNSALATFSAFNKELDETPATLILVSGAAVGTVTVLGVLASTAIPAAAAGFSTLSGAAITAGGAIATVPGALLLLGAVLAGLVTNVGNFRTRVVAGLVAASFGIQSAFIFAANKVMGVWNEMVEFVIKKTDFLLVEIQKLINKLNKVRAAAGKEPIQPLAEGLEAATVQDEEKFDLPGREDLRERLSAVGIDEETREEAGSDTFAGAFPKLAGDVGGAAGKGALEAAGFGGLLERVGKEREELLKKAKEGTKTQEQIAADLEKRRKAINKKLGTATTGAGTGTDTVGGGFPGLPGPLAGIISGDVKSIGDLTKGTTASAPSESVSGGDITASASDIQRAMERALNSALPGTTFRFDDGGTTREATIQDTGGTEQARRESRLGNRSVNL